MSVDTIHHVLHEDQRVGSLIGLELRLLRLGMQSKEAKQADQDDNQCNKDFEQSRTSFGQASCSAGAVSI